MKTVRRKFQPEFHAAVRSGAKLHTLRPIPSYVPQPGDLLIAEAWEGKPYRSTVIELARGVISRESQVVWLFFPPGENMGMTISGAPQEWNAIEVFAQADGFPDAARLRQWFEGQYGCREFQGCLIHWTLNPEGGAPCP